jgi:uncharacterized repeat protein (TIGR03803 family)
MSKLGLRKTTLLSCVFCAATAIASAAQTPMFTSLLSFNVADGAEPVQVLVQGADGDLYGTTSAGGANNAGGTVFKITPGFPPTLTTLYNFCSQTNCTDGELEPLPGGSGLLLAIDGNFYGTTPLGGANSNCNGGSQSCGTVFKITPAGALTTLHSFSASEGSFPNGLVQATDGNFYGTAQQGGANNAGAVFQITPTGKLTTLYNFCAQTNCTDGGVPEGSLVQATDGNFYGTTAGGGTGNGGGTVFKITPKGKLTTLATVGGSPADTLVQAIDGNFYGTTAGGTIFQMTPGGSVTTLATNCCFLYAGLVQATDLNFYGVTFTGGTSPPNCGSLIGNVSCGSVFEVTAPSGMPPVSTLAMLYSFCPQTPCTDGAGPLAGLMQATDGTLYGTTAGGGTYGFGTVFSLSVGLGPFVKPLPTSGKVRTAVTIVGNNLTGTTSVTFNGTAAAFTVVSSTEITTTVPKGATTGEVQVTTPSGTLSSNVPFRVTK